MAQVTGRAGAHYAGGSAAPVEENERGTAKQSPADWWRGSGRRAVPLWRPVTILVAARLAMWAAVFVFSHLFNHYTLNPWDGGWYVLAAKQGWPHHVLTGLGGAGQDTLAFFPGFPTVIRVVHFLLPLSWPRAGEVAAFVTEIAMVAGVWLLARDVWDSTVADRSVVAMCFFPGAFVLAMMYSEPLTIACAAFCLLALRHRLWVLAGLLAAVGGATRIVGVALVAVCAWEAGRAIARDREWRSLAAVVLSPLGIVGWFAYLWASTGDLTAWLDTEKRGWAQHSTPAAIPDLIRSVLHTHPAQVGDVLAVAGTALAVAMLVCLIVAMIKGGVPSAWVVYSAVLLVIAATSVNPAGIRFRFVWTAFPLVLVAARYLKEAAFSVAVAFSSVLTGVILVVTLMGPALIP